MRVLKAYLGWANEETHGGNNLRLYALDEGGSPRWAPDGGRTVERALLMKTQTGEGDRYLVVYLGDRFFSDEKAEHLTNLIQADLDGMQE
jgi:hypothetical protein